MKNIILILLLFGSLTSCAQEQKSGLTIALCEKEKGCYDGTTISFWLTPSTDVCLPYGQFAATGFYNLGYFSIDGITYLITERSSSNFHLTLTSVTNETYNFNTAGYTTLGQ